MVTFSKYRKTGLERDLENCFEKNDKSKLDLDLPDVTLDQLIL